MTNSNLRTSAKMAVVLGIFLPIAETVRRFNQLLDYREFLSWFDDYILGAVLLWAAFGALKNRKNAVSYLIAAWGIATGAMFLSFLGQFRYYETTGEPGIFSTTFVLVAKALFLAFVLVGLIKAIRSHE